MAKSDTVNQAISYNTVQNLTHELLEQADDPEIQALTASLLPILKKARGPITRERAVTEAIASIAQVKSANRQLKTALKVNRKRNLLESIYQPAPGKKQIIKPGPLLVCPVEGCQYEQFFMQKGEEYTCPLHDVALKPKPKRKRGKRT